MHSCWEREGFHREVDETSERSAVSKFESIPLTSAVIGDIPEEHKFVVENAEEGLLLSRQLIATAFKVPLMKVIFYQLR